MVTPETLKDREGQRSAPAVAVLDALGGFLQHPPPSEVRLLWRASWPQTLWALMLFQRGRRRAHTRRKRTPSTPQALSGAHTVRGGSLLAGFRLCNEHGCS